MSYEDIDNDLIAGYKTFARAYESFQGKIRLMRCKGNFSTCEICNNAAYILRTQKKWTKSQRDIIIEYRRIHLKQQSDERVNLEYRKQKAAELDSFGQPTNFLLFSDAITNSLGQTPSIGKYYFCYSNKTD